MGESLPRLGGIRLTIPVQILNVVVLALIMAASASGLGRPAADLSDDAKMMALRVGGIRTSMWHDSGR